MPVVRPFAVLLPLLAGCASSSPPPPSNLPDLVVKSVQVNGLRLAGGDVQTFNLDVVVRNRGGPIGAGKSFAVAAFVRPRGASGYRHAWRVNFGAPPAEPGVMPVVALKVVGPMKPQTDKTLLTTAWTSVPASERQTQLEVVAIVDSCDAGSPCAILEQNETNNERAIQVVWP